MRVADLLWMNPVLQREWAERRRAATRLRVLSSWLGLTLLLILYGAAAYWLSREERSPWDARAFLLGICLLYLVWMSLITPGPAAARIARERERQTWDVLLLTALSPSQLVAGKLLATLWLPVQALGLGLPLLWMGGHAARLSTSRLALILTILLTATLAVSAIGLWLSHRCRRARTAIALAYVVCGAAFWLTLSGAPSRLLRGENLWWYASPAWQVTILCLAEPVPGPLVRPLLPEWSWFLLGWGTLAVLALSLLARRVAAADRD